MYDKAAELINNNKNIVVIQAENPDGDSLGTSLALEEILSDLGKTVLLYCPVDIPKYLRYISGWDRVTSEFKAEVDLAIIVDTNAEVLLSKVLNTNGVRHFLESRPVLVIDHHATASSLSFEHVALTEDVVSSSAVVYNLAAASGWTINPQAAENLLIALLSDSLGLSIQSVTPNSFFTAGKLVELGASPSVIEARRRQYMKKSADILEYKGKLLCRIEYLLEGKLALIHIPWEEIQKYSDQYNPSVLVLEEMRQVIGVEIGVAIKTYPDGKLTGKIHSNIPTAEQVAAHFNGGGHKYAAGFRTYDDYDTIIKELVNIVDKTIKEHQNDA